MTARFGDIDDLDRLLQLQGTDEHQITDTVIDKFVKVLSSAVSEGDPSCLSLIVKGITHVDLFVLNETLQTDGSEDFVFAGLLAMPILMTEDDEKELSEPIPNGTTIMTLISKVGGTPSNPPKFDETYYRWLKKLCLMIPRVFVHNNENDITNMVRLSHVVQTRLFIENAVIGSRNLVEINQNTPRCKTWLTSCQQWLVKNRLGSSQTRMKYEELYLWSISPLGTAAWATRRRNGLKPRARTALPEHMLKDEVLPVIADVSKIGTDISESNMVAIGCWFLAQYSELIKGSLQVTTKNGTQLVDVFENNFFIPWAAWGTVASVKLIRSSDTLVDQDTWGSVPVASLQNMDADPIIDRDVVGIPMVIQLGRHLWAVRTQTTIFFHQDPRLVVLQWCDCLKWRFPGRREIPPIPCLPQPHLFARMQ